MPKTDASLRPPPSAALRALGVPVAVEEPGLTRTSVVLAVGTSLAVRVCYATCCCMSWELRLCVCG